MFSQLATELSQLACLSIFFFLEVKDNFFAFKIDGFIFPLTHHLFLQRSNFIIIYKSGASNYLTQIISEGFSIFKNLWVLLNIAALLLANKLFVSWKIVPTYIKKENNFIV